MFRRKALNMQERLCQPWINWMFNLAWFFVIFVSVVDGYLLLECRDVISHTEQNPVGLMLLRFGQGRVWLFLLLKLLGTIVASTILIAIYYRSRKFGVAIAIVMAGLQFVLLSYLHW